MRVITGNLKGKKIATLEGMDVRPTTDRVKESLFNIIQFDLEGRRFLDLFAGSGQIGLEAVSRGAREAVLVDSSPRSIKVINQNVQSTGLGDKVHVVNSDFKAYIIGNTGTFDLAFLDPPYSVGLLQQALPLVAEKMNKGGTIICEHPYNEELPEQAGDFIKKKTYKYGKVMLTSYKSLEVMEE